MRTTLFISLIVIASLFLFSCYDSKSKAIIIPVSAPTEIDYDKIIAQDNCSDDMSTYFECQSLFAGGDGPSGGGDGNGEE